MKVNSPIDISVPPGAEEIASENVYAFPLTFAQQRLWFLDQLEPHAIAYLIPWSIRMNGTLNVDALRDSLNEIVRRHEILRTTFSSVDGQPTQVVAPSLYITLPVLDLSEFTEREKQAQQLAAAEGQTPFDLKTGPLVRAQLLRLAAEDHILLLTMHHIMFDGWSRRILVRELATLYEAYCAGKPSPLRGVTLQYADYAVWQRNNLQGQSLERQLAYWRAQLAGAPASLDLPTDRPRPSVQTFRGAAKLFTFSKTLSAQLNALSRQEAATPFMTLLAGFQALLSRWSGQEDIVVGTPIANRNRTEIEELIGLFANTLVLRTDVSGNPSFRALLGRVKEVALGGYAHQDMPFEKLVEEVRPERSLSHNPLFQVMFSLQNATRRDFELPGLKLKLQGSGTGTAKFDISLFMVERHEGFRGRVEYNTDLFDDATIDGLLGHFQVLLEGALANPDQPVSELPLLTEAERERLLVEWNDTQAEHARTQCLHQLFEAQVERTPHAVAGCFDQQSLTYGELNVRANQLASYLRKCGVGPEVRVGIFLERSLDMLVALLGTLKAGGAYVPLDPAHPKERIRSVLEDAKVPLVLSEQALADSLPAHSGKMILLDDERESIAQESTENSADHFSAHNLAYVLYTSGSTGKPKGVQIEHRNLVNFLASMQKKPGLGAQDTLLAVTTLSFDIAGLELYLPLVTGGKVVLASREEATDAAKLLSLLHSTQPTIMQATPATWRMLLQAGWTGAPSMKVLCGGEALPADLAEELLSHCAELWNMYGPTETTIWSSIYKVEPGLTNTAPIGRPIDNTSFYILDAGQQPVPVGVAGELYIGGEGVARGYWQRPELTREKFIADSFRHRADARLYRTGDLARYLPDGNVQFLGRSDFQVKVRGFRIELGEIETILAQHPAVQQAVVVAREDTAADKRLVAYVIPVVGQDCSASELRTHIKHELPEYMVPSAFVRLKKFPLTPNGKVDRKNLPAPEYAPSEVGGEYVGPRTTVEEVIAGIWAEVLKMDRVGMADNFFELGGHSLLATQVVSRVRLALQVELPLRALFEAPTVPGLAQRVELLQRREQGLDAPPLKPIGRDQALPLSFAQQRLWFLDQLEPDNPLYNVPHVVRMTGALNTAMLEKSLNEIVRRHEALRTSFQTVDGEPVQVMAPRLALPLAITDLGSIEEGEREFEARKLAAEEIKRPFNLRTGPLLRASLLKLSDQEHVLVLNTHHIVSDRWSLGVLSQELAALYEAFVEGKPSPLQELPIQYADYAAWQRQFLSGEVLEKQLAYWKQQLRGAPPVLEIPTDRPRPPKESFRGDIKAIPISSVVTERLKELSRGEGVTLFMTLLAAWQVLLSRYSGQEDIVVGIPIANRNRSEIEGLIGFFANTLALRGDLSGNPSFRELLTRVREVALSAYAHQDLPFEKLVEELRPERSLSHNPLFQVLFALQNTPALDQQIPGLKLRGVGAKVGTAKCDLALFMAEGPQGLMGRLEYNTDIFDASTIDRLANHFQILLQGIVADAEQPIYDLPLLHRSERDQLLVEWNATAADYPRSQCLHQQFEVQVKRAPDAVAGCFEDQSLTYRELNERANRLAHYLQKRGIGPGRLIGIYLERSLAMMVALLAVQKSGAAYVPMDPAYPADRIGFMLEDAQAPLLLTEKSLLDSVPPHAGEALCLDSDAALWAQESVTNPSSQVTPEDLVYVIFTSGSTGRPKGVQVRHRAVVNLLSCMARELDMGEHDVVPALASFAFDMCIPELYLALISGGRVVIGQSHLAANGEELAALLRKTGATLVHATPTTWSLLLEAGFTGQGLKRVIGAEPLSRELCTGLLEADPSLYNFYGPTETTVWSTFHQFRSPQEPLTVGKPLANTQVYILDKNLQPVPIGIPGEIHIGGEGVACGYLKRPELTAEKFIADPFSTQAHAKLYKTGDLARYFPDGRIEFLGRIDNQVKLRGYRIELGEIEAVLAKHPSLQAAAVVVREDMPGDKRLVAYVVPATGIHPSASELRAYLKESLPEYMVPSAVIALDKFPLTPNGKLDRGALPPPDVTLQSHVIDPRDEVESMLLEIWRGVLNLHSIGVQDNFFELGGHSLLAVRLMTEIQKTTGKAIPLATLFQGATIEHLADVLRGEALPQHQMVMTIRQGGRKPPFFAIATPGVNPLGYVAVARHLADDQPFYSIQGPGPRLKGRPYSSVEFENLANDYIKAMQTIQPRGPYYFGGMCEGARIAFDMARILEGRGEEVALLAIFDTWVIENSQNRFLWKIDYYSRRIRDFLRMSVPDKRQMILKWLRDRINRRASGNNGSRSQWPAAYWPGPSFVPPKFGGKITILKRPKQPYYYVNDPHMGWGARTTEKVELHLIEVNTRKHILLLREPYVRQVAEKLSDSLRHARTRGSEQLVAMAVHLGASLVLCLGGFF